MQKDFHYYATYSAAILAGFSHEESLTICYSDQLTDCCTATFLSKIGGPVSAATTQLNLEMMDRTPDRTGLQDITRIWASFHFLPKDLYAQRKGCSKRYMDKYRLICGPNSDLLLETVNLHKGTSLQAVGIAMHILADTWAHSNFAGTPSLVINDINRHIFEIIPDGDSFKSVHIEYVHSLGVQDDAEKMIYNSSPYQPDEDSIMNLGHGRIGHLPDYSYIRYRYMPAWGDYREIVKDNPSDYYNAFCQMISALKYIRGANASFEKAVYDYAAAEPWKEEITAIFEKRQTDSCADWKAFGEKLTGKTIEDFDEKKYEQEYIDAPADKKSETFLGKYIAAAQSQKSMVTNRIYRSGNRLAGISKGAAK